MIIIIYVLLLTIMFIFSAYYHLLIPCKYIYINSVSLMFLIDEELTAK